MMPSFYNGSPQPETGSSSSAMEIAQLTVKSSSPTLENHHHQHQQQQKQNHNRHRHYPQPSIKNQTPEPSQSFQIPPYDTSLGPIGIPDLNISLEEFAQRNYSKIKAAQARQRRIRICKTKNSNAAIKLQSPNPCSGRASDSI
ncbi:uncharacterized protein LOC111013942 [Momordica charantia]|uniref:Uncharacterized protein LOC111013942 n=1 Tax=Momordica charantia TaxID=3673 RepID=A0A6J1CSM9_MOMCH|nr:uncharacterized protein LOC111013942 [Momordica charantia]